MTSTSIPAILDEEQGEKTFLSEAWYQVWKATGETTNGVVETWFEVVPPHMGPPEHLHERFDECFWVVKGNFLIKVAERIVKVSEGTWIFVPRGTPHGFRNIGAENGHLLIQALPTGEMRKYFEEVGEALRSEPANHEALQHVNERYGIVEVGPPLTE
ncbi:cupin domain-containing protein [Ktedonosporobacter rubrisoli]|uniref:Cupin domain-containing protein n=1 Tax=Ktedonosporobacter rubrisoli TaxID=2509675 RepID=A0A4P6JRJ3_KTERU|nr:cupin domain-containing protein [Ktedonosporobacter rubrisoli]QBD78097.1 cupin domain-containing protein [Ktedonosporobacter rubrisoli]